MNAVCHPERRPPLGADRGHPAVTATAKDSSNGEYLFAASKVQRQDEH